VGLGSRRVSLPHKRRCQQGLGTSVNQADLRPGDLVFFGSPAYHVAIYIAQGLIIHAPTNRRCGQDRVAVNHDDYSGATRVG